MNTHNIFSIIVFTLALFIAEPNQASSFSSILPSKNSLIEVRIEGIKITDALTPITVNNPSPTFSGYALSNTKIILILEGESIIQREALSDANGFWSYTLNQNLKEDEHNLTIRLVNSLDESGEDELVATFLIEDDPNVLGVVTKDVFTVPNYWTLSIVTGSSLLVLLFFYLLLQTKAHKEVTVRPTFR